MFLCPTGLLTIEDERMDDIFLFVDHWVITRSDGLHILNGTPEQFEQALHRLVNQLTSKKESVEYSNDE